MADVTSTNQFAIGFVYEMELKLTPLVPKDEQGKAIVNEKVYFDAVGVSYIDSGPITVTQTNNRTDAEVDRDIRSDYGTMLGELPVGTTLDATRVLTETGKRYVYCRGRVEDSTLSVSTDTHLPIRIAAISQRGTIIQKP